MLDGVAHGDIVRQIGVSSGVISALRKDLKAHHWLYRSDGSAPCVDIACRAAGKMLKRESKRAVQAQEFAGGPGRTRTCNDTVMSGGL